MNKIAVVGGGGHAKVLISIIKKIKKYEIVGYTDLTDYGNILGVKYLGYDELLSDFYEKDVNNAVLGIGQIKLTNKRFEVIKKLKRIGFNLPPIISPNAIINESVNIGEGVQIFDGVVINSGSNIGNHSIINSNATIEHDCEIGEFCHIATAAVLSGGVKIGDLSMIGSGAIILQYRTITPNCMIGSGGVVIKDINEEGTYVGNPVKKIE